MSDPPKRILQLLVQNRSRPNAIFANGSRADPFSGSVHDFYRFNKNRLKKLGIEKLILRTSRGNVKEYYSLLDQNGHIPSFSYKSSDTSNFFEFISKSILVNNKSDGSNEDFKAQIIIYTSDTDIDQADLKDLSNYLLHDLVGRFRNQLHVSIDRGYSDIERAYQRYNTEGILPGTLARSIVRRLAHSTNSKLCAFAILKDERMFLEYASVARRTRKRSENIYGGIPFPFYNQNDLNFDLERMDASAIGPIETGILKFFGFDEDDITSNVSYFFIRCDNDVCGCLLFWWGDSIVELSNPTIGLIGRGVNYLQNGTKFLFQRRVGKLIVDPIFRNRETRIRPGSCFVIMPFGEVWSENVYGIVKDVLEDSEYAPVRADEMHGENIVEDIWSAIVSSEIIVADVTGKNPNVYYELGICHTIGKKIILLTQSVADIPFDTRHLRHVVYSNDLGGFKDIRSGISGFLRR